MASRWPFLGTLLAGALLLVPFQLFGQDKEPAKKDKPAKEPQEVVLKGTLTGLQQEITHSLPLKKDMAYTVTVDSRGEYWNLNRHYFWGLERSDARALLAMECGGSGRIEASAWTFLLPKGTEGEIRLV